MYDTRAKKPIWETIIDKHWFYNVVPSYQAEIVLNALFMYNITTFYIL